MKKLILYIFIFIISCNNDNINHNAVGKYVNAYDSESIHYVELRSDSTFIHFYKKSNIISENTGYWKLLKFKNKTEVVFRTWKNFGYEKSIKCNDCVRFVILKNNELIFDYDLLNEMNFRKMK